MSKVKMQLQDAVNGFGALNSFSNSARLSWELSWKIDDIVEALEKHQKRYQEEVNNMMKAYGEPLEADPSRYRILPENAEAYNKAAETLGESMVTVDFEPIPFDELEKSGAKVSGREMRGLKKFFVSKKEAPKPDEKKKKAKEEAQQKVEEKVEASS